MKPLKWIALALTLGTLFATGCRGPVKTYKLETSTPNVWAEKPTQKVAFTVEWRH